MKNILTSLLIASFFCSNAQSITLTPSNHEIEGKTLLNFKTNGATRMTILSDGKAGIGTSSPIVLQHNHQATNTAKSIIKLTNTLSGITVNDGLDIGFEPNLANARLWNYEAGSLSVGTNNVERINISSSGNVGIGTNSTGIYKLYVQGATAIDGDLNVSTLTGGGTRNVYVNASGTLFDGPAPSTKNTYSQFLNISSANARNIGTTSLTNFKYMANACLAFFSSGVKYGEGKIVMPVEFPHEAVLSEMTLHAVDNVNIDYLVAYLMIVPITGTPTTESIITSVNTSTFPLNVNVQEISKNFSYTVDNKNFYYYLLIDINSNSANWGDSGLAIRGVRFAYSVTY